MTEAISIAANAIPVAAIIGSVVTLCWLFLRHIAGQPLLPYEPRRPIPWNAAAPIALLAFVLTPALAASVSGISEPAESTEPAAADVAALTSMAAGAGATAGPVAEYAVQAAGAESIDAWTAEPAEGLSLWAVAILSLIHI